MSRHLEFKLYICGISQAFWAFHKKERHSDVIGINLTPVNFE